MPSSYKTVSLLLATFTLSIATLVAKQPLKEVLKEDIKYGDDDHLISFLRKHVNHDLKVKTVRSIARKMRAKDLIKATNATKKSRLEKLGITKGQFLSIAYFIETQTNGHRTHYNKRDTGLSHTVEYDHKTNQYFIVLEGSGVYLDHGAKKTVSKALCYKPDGAIVVARAEQTIEMDRELEMTKRLRGKPGLFKTLGICHHHDETGIQYHTIYSKLYVPGSIQALVRKDYKLSLYEKARVAFGISLGLKTLHERGIVHRDLGIKNYLCSVPKGKPGRRKITACIADFGRTEFAKDTVPSERLQGNTTYIAPEGHFFETLTEEDHYKLDVFAVGCVLYRIFYNKKAPWQDKSYVLKDPRPKEMRHREHLERVIGATAFRRNFLAQLPARSTKQEFEYTILRMLDTDPEDRITATEIHKAFKTIYENLK